MANPHRATVAVKLGDVEHDVCLTNAALVEIETELKLDAPDLLDGRAIGIAKSTVIIHAGLRAAGKQVDRKAVVKMLDAMKPGDVILAAVQALRAAFTDPDPNPPQEGASPSAKSPGSA
jgi:hypothetical protein